jgi:UTP--glucose-1-phosphate uridylyltransferase
MQKIDTVIFPVAGLGTRFLPATKAIPKEILTLVDRPLIQYAVDEARDAGIENFIFVTSRGKSALENFFDEAPELEATLRDAGKTDLLDMLRATNMAVGAITYVRQPRALGLGHAVWCARKLVADRAVAVILPDDVIVAEKPCLAQMMEAHSEVGGTMVATMTVLPEEVSRYGIVDPGLTVGPLVRARGIIEKPPLDRAPSRQAVVGRYILDPGVMRALDSQEPGAGGEIQLTDAIMAEIAGGERPVHGFRFAGTRYDCGSKAGFMRASMSLALGRSDLSDEMITFMEGCIAAAKPRRDIPVPALDHRLTEGLETLTNGAYPLSGSRP